MTLVDKASAFPKSVQPGIPMLGPKPFGWTRGPLSKHLVEYQRPIKMEDDTEYRLVTVKRSRGGVIERERLKGRDIAVKSQYLLQAGDFLISKRQIVHGACGLVPVELDGSIASGEYSVLRGKPTVDLQFLSYLAHSIYFQQTCFHSSIGVHVEKMIFKLDRWLEWDFDMPPIAEQRKIAEILSTWDRAIALQEKLVANARAQKKSLMQQILSGKKRLPGFQGEWARTTLGDVFDFKNGLNGDKSLYGSGTKFVNVMDVFRGSSLRHADIAGEMTVSASQLSEFGLKRGDVLFNRTSETEDEIALSTVYLDSKPAVFGGFVIRARPKDSSILPEYSAYGFQSQPIRRELIRLGQGAIRSNIGQVDLMTVPISIPSIAEQRSIAEVLSSMDKAIIAQEQLIGKARTEKKALMQQLLTGKRRVKILEEVA